jgi:hypothetical protein
MHTITENGPGEKERSKAFCFFVAGQQMAQASEWANIQDDV